MTLTFQMPRCLYSIICLPYSSDPNDLKQISSLSKVLPDPAIATKTYCHMFKESYCPSNKVPAELSLFAFCYHVPSPFSPSSLSRRCFPSLRVVSLASSKQVSHSDRCSLYRGRQLSRHLRFSCRTLRSSTLAPASSRALARDRYLQI